jgi:DNA primase
MLLLYGNQKQEFEDLVLKENEEGDLVLQPEIVEAKVYEKIYLALQEDEIELSNEDFKAVYYKLIEELNENDDFNLNEFMTRLDQDFVNELSSLLMEEEKYTLHDWERRDIYPKEKEQGIAQLVDETILTLRCNLIKNRIAQLQKNTKESNGDHSETLEEIMNYLQLNKLLNAKLSRVLS